MSIARRFVAIVLFLLVGAGLFAFAVGAGASRGALRIAADPSGKLSFNTTKLSAKAGKITFKFINRSVVLHNLAIRQGPRCKVEYRCEALSAFEIASTGVFAHGGSKTLTVKLKPGTYIFFCAVPGHQAGGMQGTLTVTP